MVLLSGLVTGPSQQNSALVGVKLPSTKISCRSLATLSVRCVGLLFNVQFCFIYRILVGTIPVISVTLFLSFVFRSSILWSAASFLAFTAWCLLLASELTSLLVCINLQRALSRPVLARFLLCRDPCGADHVIQVTPSGLTTGLGCGLTADTQSVFCEAHQCPRSPSVTMLDAFDLP